ncbi:MAG: hypothetical protein JSS87_11120 [Acidobacteria bacterium]|nr:hypothetical protein [Acidobacteriota bacterium]
MNASRRSFLSTALLGLPAARIFAQSTAPATLSIQQGETGPTIPQDFVGLSYEVQQLTDPTFFSLANHGLIAQFRALSHSGVLRLGGNTSEFAYWKPTADTQPPSAPNVKTVVGHSVAQFYPVTPQAIRNLAAFLRATGWTCLYGMNLGTNTPARAAEEAAFVAKTLGNRLQYFQIGNEVDLFDKHIRDPKTWSVKEYLKEWLAIARAIVAVVPNAKFGIPDVASKIDWLKEVATLWPTIPNPPHVTTLSHHYYFGGPATNPKVNIPALLSDKSKVIHDAKVASAAAAKMGVRVRMTEGNTCYRGGKPGVSDVFASALWAADYALTLASFGYSGVNLHGGTGKSVANSVGGFLPGDIMLKEAGISGADIQKHPHPFYTPIATFNGKYVAEPVSYGLRFAGLFSGATLLPVDFNPGPVNATAYAAKLPSTHLSFIVINKDATQDLNLTLNFGKARSGVVLQEMLSAPSLEAREAHITRSPKLPHLKDGKLIATVPYATAIRFTLT